MLNPPLGLTLDQCLHLLDLSLTQWTQMESLSAEALSLLEEAQPRLAKGEPLAYVAGWAPFLDMRLLVQRDVLIPRPETEEWMERWLEEKPLPSSGRVLDLGTGSGALALAVQGRYPGATVVAVDRSWPALQIAQANANRLKRRVHFLHASWFSALQPASFDWILSNPPYVPTHFENPSLQFEPASALYAGEDGLEDVRHLLSHLATYLRPGGHYAIEIGVGQGQTALQLSHPGLSLNLQQDEAGRDRLLHGQRLSL